MRSTSLYRASSRTQALVCECWPLTHPMSMVATSTCMCQSRETARRTIRDGKRASDVITRLRALFSRKSASTESVDLNEATREVIALSSSKLQENTVILRLELAD